MLATKLRLSPQTRLDPKTVARHYANFDPNAPTPWEEETTMRHSDDDETRGEHHVRWVEMYIACIPVVPTEESGSC